MEIWFDACTGKHVRYGVAIAKRLRERGHNVIFTTREHPDTLDLCKTLGEIPVVVGRYRPDSLQSRLEESARRMLQFIEMFENNTPNVAISSQSVELCRVAFGLGIHTLMTADTPHAEAVNRLTVPLIDDLVTSAAIPNGLFKRYGAKKIHQFHGVDEVAWIKGFKPSKMGRFGRPLIVVRQMETKAAYALQRKDETEVLAHKLAALGTVVFIPRYDKSERKGLAIIKEFVDDASLAGNSDLVVSVGGTISREAALQGVPSIVISDFGRIHVNEYLSKKGFPLFATEARGVMNLAKMYLGKKWDVRQKISELEDPLDLITKLVEEKR